MTESANDPRARAQDLLAYIAASPTPHHCVAESARRLEAAGFRALDPGNPWTLAEGDARYVARDGALVAFRVGLRPPAESGFRVIGAHTDSPNLRVKPAPDARRGGFEQLGVEVYGGALTYTWLDRDLGLAGAVHLAADSPCGVETRLVLLDRPLLRVPSLAIHLNREIYEQGLKLNPQEHLVPLLAASDDGERAANDPGRLRRLVGAALDVDPAALLGFDLSLMDVSPPALGGNDDEWILSPRLDDQAMCHAALSALVAAPAAAGTQVVCLYDHEEVGSGSATGATGPLVDGVLRRLAEHEGPGAAAGALVRAAARSMQLSADMAHALHPNYADKHEPQHRPRLNGGPVLKVNVQQRYATSGLGAALFERLCHDVEVPCQRFVARTDMPCGSTIGPLSAARLGIRTVDVGNPMLAMHSLREMGGAEDPARMEAVMTRFLACPSVG